MESFINDINNMLNAKHLNNAHENNISSATFYRDRGYSYIWQEYKSSYIFFFVKKNYPSFVCICFTKKQPKETQQKKIGEEKKAAIKFWYMLNEPSNQGSDRFRFPFDLMNRSLIH